jgi:DNA-directed RNA polymerase subunit RPC12/RpoP
MKRVDQSKCARCDAEDFTPNVEAFELSGQIVCEECAEEVFAENSQFGMGA